MEDLWLPLAALGIVAIGALAWLVRRKPAAAPARGGKRGAEGLDTLMAWHPQPTRILTAPERQALRLLRHTLPEHLILAQVPLARFIKVPTRHSYAEWLRRVGQICADLVVCDADSQVLAVVEIRVARGQESEKARRRHARMDRVVQAAGIPLHVWTEGELPSPMAVRELFASLASTAAPVAPAAASGPGAAALAGQPPFEETEPDDDWPQDQDPPPSTWFDDIDSGQVPLDPANATTARPGQTRAR